MAVGGPVHCGRLQHRGRVYCTSRDSPDPRYGLHMTIYGYNTSSYDHIWAYSMVISMHLVTAPTPEASTAAPTFRTWKLNELIDKGQFTLGKKLGVGATNIAHVVTVEGARYAGK